MKFKARTNSSRQLEVNWNTVNVYVSRWKPGTLLDVEITRRTKKKSIPLQGYYFKVVLPALMEHLGYEREEDALFHRQLKIVYFRIGPDAKGIHRNVPSVFGDTSELSIAEKTDFVQWVLRTASREGCYCPDPEKNNEKVIRKNEGDTTGRA